MPHIKRAASFAIALQLFIGSAVTAAEFATPEEAVKTYITAVSTGSGKHIEMAFTPSASIQYYNAKGEYLTFKRDDFAKLVDSGNQWDAKIEITDMKMTGRAANATVEFTWGENGEKGYVDYLNLTHDGESWHITDKVAQYVDR